MLLDDIKYDNDIINSLVFMKNFFVLKIVLFKFIKYCWEIWLFKYVFDIQSFKIEIIKIKFFN